MFEHAECTVVSSTVGQFEVVVVGGGPAGIGACIAAGRMGANVALVERHDILGGMSTAGLVNNFANAHWDGQRFIIGGIFGELRQRLIDRKALIARVTATGGLEPHDPTVFAEETKAMCEQAGVSCLLGQSVQASDFCQTGTMRLQLDNRTDLEAKVVVDASGDAVVAAQAGVPYNLGRSGDHAVMPLTYCYIIGPVDLDKVKRECPWMVRQDQGSDEFYLKFGNMPKSNEWVKQARKNGEMTIPLDRVITAISLPGKIDYLSVNFGRVFIDDPTDPKQLAKAEQEGKKQIDEGVKFFRKYLSGFENVELVEIARQIGVRESRQIVGLYTLTAEDIFSCRQFEDVVAQCCYPIDVHEPDSEQFTIKHLPPGQHYDIPWRCLVPKLGPPNLVAAGRCISATHEAMSSFRVAPSVMAIGEAAGVTAALALQGNQPIRQVTVDDVQERLRETGGILS